MTPLARITSRAVVLAVDDVDTDQIIPARFLTTVSRQGLGEHLFHDWRYDAAGSPRPGFVLNQPTSRDAAILVAGHNFGCGSSREHAPWALAEYGFRAIIGTSFADIFRQNALKNGIVPVVFERPAHGTLVARLRQEPAALVTVDLVSLTVTVPGGDLVPFSIDSFARECLLHGVDELGFVLHLQDEIASYEREHEPRINTLAG